MISVVITSAGISPDEIDILYQYRYRRCFSTLSFHEGHKDTSNFQSGAKQSERLTAKYWGQALKNSLLPSLRIFLKI